MSKLIKDCCLAERPLQMTAASFHRVWLRLPAASTLARLAAEQDLAESVQLAKSELEELKELALA